MAEKKSKSSTRRQRTGDSEIDALLADLVERLPERNRGLVAEAVATSLRLGLDGADRGDLKIVTGALRELRRSFVTFDKYAQVRKVSIYGSARIDNDDPTYRVAFEFARRLCEAGWMVITGAGSGIMAAANEGAGAASGFGLGIRLPWEETANPTIHGDEKHLTFRYFFARKVIFVKYAHAFAFFPGGFGTLDEAFETLTLIQTGKAAMTPIVLITAQGDDYWAQWERFVRSDLLASGLISSADLSLFVITDSVEHAVAEVERFYSNYQSMRYVGRHLYLRVLRVPNEADLAELEADFADILVEDGKIEAAPPHPDEIADDDFADLPRIRLGFDRRHFGRLRQLIDRLNEDGP